MGWPPPIVPPMENTPPRPRTRQPAPCAAKISDLPVGAIGCLAVCPCVGLDRVNPPKVTRITPCRPQAATRRRGEAGCCCRAGRTSFHDPADLADPAVRFAHSAPLQFSARRQSPGGRLVFRLPAIFCFMAKSCWHASTALHTVSGPALCSGQTRRPGQRFPRRPTPPLPQRGLPLRLWQAGDRDGWPDWSMPVFGSSLFTPLCSGNSFSTG